MTINSVGTMINPAQHIPVGSAQGPRDGSGPKGQEIQQQMLEQAQQKQQQQKLQENQMQNQQAQQNQQQNQQQIQQQAAQVLGVGINLNIMA